MSADRQPDAMESIPRGVFRTADLPPGQRNRAWNEIAQPFFDHVVPLADREMEGEIATQLLGGWLGSVVRFNSHSYARGRAHSPDAGRDYCFIQLYRSGTLQGDCDGRAVQVRPGDILFIDVGEPLTLRATAGEIAILILPRAELGWPATRLHGHVLERESPATRELARCLEPLAPGLPALTRAEARDFKTCVRPALVAALEHTLGQPGEGPSARGVTMRSAESLDVGECSNDTAMREIHDTLRAWGEGVRR